MIISEIIKLSNDCIINAYYTDDYPADITIEYTEYSQDCDIEDTETSIKINKEKAIEIIAFLQKHFKLERKDEQKTI
jgi:hypothetical protein